MKTIEALKQVKEILKELNDDSWFKNGFVPAGDEQTRQAILVEQVSQMTRKVHLALTALEHVDLDALGELIEAAKHFLSAYKEDHQAPIMAKALEVAIAKLKEKS